MFSFLLTCGLLNPRFRCTQLPAHARTYTNRYIRDQIPTVSYCRCYNYYLNETITVGKRTKRQSPTRYANRPYRGRRKKINDKNKRKKTKREKAENVTETRRNRRTTQRVTHGTVAAAAVAEDQTTWSGGAEGACAASSAKTLRER